MGKINSENAITYYEGSWHDGNPEIFGPKTHGLWLSSTVFDGARAIQGQAPDLDLHCARLLVSGESLGLCSPVTTEEIIALSKEGMAKFPTEVPLYICPMLLGGSGFIYPDPDDTKFVLSIYESQLPEQPAFSAIKSSYRRPSPETAPTQAKASCLYPNVSRAVLEAKAAGCDTAVMLDPMGAVAEFSYANLFFVKDATVITPAINGTFLNGITRQRVIQLLRNDGVTVIERTVAYEELLSADEIFGTGNYYKVAPCTQLDGRAIPHGPITQHTEKLYWNFAGI